MQLNFSEKRTFFCRVSLFIFSRLSYTITLGIHNFFFHLHICVFRSPLQKSTKIFNKDEYMQFKISSKEVSTIILYSRGVVCIFTKLWTAASTFIRLPAILMSLTVIPFCRGEYSALICPMSFSIGTLPLLTLQLRASLLSLLLATASLKGTIRKSKSV